MRRIRFQKILLVLTLVLFAAACGSGGGGGGQPSSQNETKWIGGGGGVAKSSDEKASVTIPPGVLSKDTEITVESVSNQPVGNIGSAYEFGPDGTTFSGPVMISIQYDEAILPSGISESDLRLGKLVSNQWQEVADSIVDTSANSVSGTTTSFSIYGVIVAPKFSGFGLTLEKGTFWEYRWDYYESTSAQGGGGGTSTDAGRFRVALGPPKDINGVPAYEVQVSGKTQNDFLPRWKYLAIANNQILGSEDGTTLTVLFDAKTGQWAGGGFFTTFPSGKLVIAENSTMSNDYISGPAVKVSQSANKDQCEYFSDTGSICGDSSFSYTKNEYYREGIGPIGYYYYNSFMDCGGNFCSGATWKENVGLVASSLSGDVATYDLETEPNDSPQTAQPLTLPVTIGGDTETGDPGYLKLLKDGSDFLYVKIEDWYTFTLASADTAGITLAYSFTNRENTGLDLYLVDETETVVSKSRKDNPALNDPNESINAPLQPGRYYIGVQAWSTPKGRIEYTLKVSSATQPAPDSEAPTVPAGLTATAVSSSRIDLSWAASTDNVGVTGYRVERCQGTPCDNFTEIGTSATTTYNDTAGLTAATGYTYRVRAVDAAGKLSSYSNSAGDATWSAADTQVPTAPTGFTATAVPALSWSQVDFSWNASIDNVGVAGYKIYFTGGKFVTSATGTSASITDIASNIYVCFRVFAYDAAGNESPGSAQACVTTLPPTDITAPTVPTGLNPTAISASQINLSWNASTDNVGVDSYNIYFGSGTYIQTVTGTSGSMTGLSSATQYCFTVSARDVVGNESPKSAPACATTIPLPDMTPPTAPINLTATPMSSSRIDLSWNASTDNVGVTGYRVERCQGTSCSNFAEITTINAGLFFLYSNTELTASTSYTYRVRAVDAAGNLSDYSNAASATTDLLQVQYTLTVSKAGTGSGTVASSPAGINCGTDCTENYNSGTVVTLTATAATGSVFAGWSMECSPTVICPVTLDAAKIVTATFNLIQYTLTVSKAGTGSGTVTSSPVGITCGTDCTENYNSGTAVMLTATAAPGSVFAGWSGACTGTGACAVTLGAAKTVTATFNLILILPQTDTLNPQYDNQVYVQSVMGYISMAGNVYQNGTLPVGCDWTYNLWGEFWYQDYICGQGLVKFDVSSLVGKTIDSATLKLEVSSAGVGYYPRQWHIRAMLTSWSPATVTWNVVESSFSYDGSEIIQNPPTYAGQFYNIDVTSIVQNWASGTWNNYGLLFGSHNNTPPNATSWDSFEFYSLEDPGQGWPKLVVTYH